MKVGSHLSLGSSRPCGDKPERNNMIKAEKKIYRLYCRCKAIGSLLCICSCNVTQSVPRVGRSIDPLWCVARAFT
jgi:hypothetical protein